MTLREKMGSQCQRYLRLCNLCVYQGCKPSQTPGSPDTVNPQAAHEEESQGLVKVSGELHQAGTTGGSWNDL